MAATPWPQQYQQYQQHQQPTQNYPQSQQYPQGQQYQQTQPYQQDQQYQTQQYQYQQPPQGYPVQQYQHNQQYQAHHYQQPQQGQPTQQYQPARQGPQTAQQYPQPQPSQSAQQYPQQQPQQLQAHNGYQHQYAPYQYPPQQYAPQQQVSAHQHGTPPLHPSPQQPAAPQQYVTPQYGTHQQASQAQRNPAQGKDTPQTVPQPCFNCGNSGHYAMACPEPIRAVPAGRINPQAFQNPLRRPKAGGTVVTQHQHTPNPGHAQASPKGYPLPPHGHTGYPQYPHHPQQQQGYSPATPLSAHSPAQAQYCQQWQQYYQSQQAYQGNDLHHQGSPYHQQPYAAPHDQPVRYPDGSQTPSQAPLQTPNHTGVTQMYQSQFPPTSASPVQSKQQFSRNNATTQPNQRTQSLGSMKSQSTSPSLHKAEILDYDFEDDLDSLDIPDLPQNTLIFTNASRQPVNLTRHPLPGNFIVADALAPFPPPDPQDEGRCKSKYQFDASLKGCLEHFKDSKYWDKEHADDVVFFDLPADGKVVPVDEVLSTIRQRRTHPEFSEDLDRNSRSQSRTIPVNQDSLDMKTTIERLEREMAETKAKLDAKLGKGKAANPVHGSTTQSVQSVQPRLRDHEIKEEYQTPPQPASFEKATKSEKDTEDVLAALGVTGAPKPVTATHWPDHTTGHGSPNDMHMSRSSSSSKADIPAGEQHQISPNDFQVTPEFQAKGSNTNNQHSVPPPPPPIPFRQHSYPNGTDGSPLSTGLTSINPFGHNTTVLDHSNGNGNGLFSPPTDGQASSPNETRSEKSLSRKRHRDSSSDEGDTPKRRQEDDYTPKLKKRQPKVAEAYSRRW